MRCVERTAQNRIVGTAKPNARDLRDLLAERALLVVQLFQGQLGKPGLIAFGQRIRGISTTVQTNIPQRSESGAWVSSFCSIGDPFNTKNAPHPSVPRARFATSFAMISSAPGSVCGRPSTAGGQARSQSPAPFAEPPSPCVFRAFATWATGVFALECALSSGTSSLVQGLRTGVFFFCISFRPILAGRCNIVAHLAQPNARILRVRSGCHLHRERHRHCSLRLRPAGAVIGRNCRPTAGAGRPTGPATSPAAGRAMGPQVLRLSRAPVADSMDSDEPPAEAASAQARDEPGDHSLKTDVSRHPSHVALAAASATATASCAWQPLVLRRPLN